MDELGIDLDLSRRHRRRRIGKVQGAKHELCAELGTRAVLPWSSASSTMPVTNRATVSRCSEDPPWVSGDLHSATPGAMSSSVVRSMDLPPLLLCTAGVLGLRTLCHFGALPPAPSHAFHADNLDRGRAAIAAAEAFLNSSWNF